MQATFIVSAQRGHRETLERQHLFQVPFLGACAMAFSLTRAAERRARMVRAHETELAARQRELASLEQRLGEAVGEKDRLVEDLLHRIFLLIKPSVNPSDPASQGGLPDTQVKLI